MAVKLHQPVAGLNAGDSYSGPMEQFLLVQGYASNDSTVDVQDVAAVDDPRLAENREAPGQPASVKGKATGESKPAVENDPSKAEPLPPRRKTVVGEVEPEVEKAPTSKAKTSSDE